MMIHEKVHPGIRRVILLSNRIVNEVITSVAFCLPSSQLDADGSLQVLVACHLQLEIYIAEGTHVTEKESESK